MTAVLPLVPRRTPRQRNSSISLETVASPIYISLLLETAVHNAWHVSKPASDSVINLSCPALLPLMPLVHSPGRPRLHCSFTQPCSGAGACYRSCCSGCSQMVSASCQGFGQQSVRTVQVQCSYRSQRQQQFACIQRHSPKTKGRVALQVF
jgi:hypothetical protein